MAVSRISADWGGPSPRPAAKTASAVQPRTIAPRLRADAPRPVVQRLSAPAPRPAASGNWFTRLFAPAPRSAPRKSAAQVEAEGKAAKDRADAMRSGSSTAGGWSAGQRAPVSTPAVVAAASADQDRRLQEAAANESQARQRARSTGAQEKRRLSWDEYEKLGDSERAAVDFNGLLEQALQKDRDLLDLDLDKSGTVTMKEAAPKVRDAGGYRAAYERVYGSGPDENDAYAPNTLSLLNSMGLRDSGADISEYLAGSGFVTESDVKRGALAGAQAGPSLDEVFLDRQARDQLAANVTAGMARLERTLAAGRAKVAGGNVRVSLDAGSIDDAQRSGFIDSLRTSLLRDGAPATFALEGEGPQFDLEGGISVNPLIAPGTQERFGAMAQEFERQISLGATVQELMDKRQLEQAGFGESGFDLREWVDYVATRDRDAKKGGTTVEQDLMAQLGPSGGVD